jgi:hypothetical protein
MVEFDRPTLFQTVTINHDILPWKRRSSARRRRHGSTHGDTACGRRDSVLKLVHAMLLLPVNSLLFLLTSRLHRRNVRALHALTNSSTSRAHDHLRALARLRSVGTIGASHAFATFLSAEWPWLGH